MMEWYQVLFNFLTNGIRIFLCFCLIAALLKFPNVKKYSFLLSLGSTTIITVLSFFLSSQFYLLGIETVLLFVTARYLFQRQTRMCLFVIVFYEIAAALLGMFGIIALSEQSIIPLSDSSLTTWIILSLMIMMAVLFFNLNRQYEMEKEIARLKAEQTELLERDFQTLNNSYSINAKLFHDLHNHIEILQCFLVQGKAGDALEYLDDIHAPIQEVTQTFWTGDEAADYLINSKISLAQQQKIQIEINIEFPCHTNIRSADLTAILGNLLDNALEAISKSPDTCHFINLTIRRINDMLVIKVENDCKSISISSNGDLQTTKSDNGLHGWGLKSARAAAERYDGTVETTYTDNLFCAVATLSYKYSKIE